MELSGKGIHVQVRARENAIPGLHRDQPLTRKNIDGYPTARAQCSVPYFVVSNMSKIRKASLMTPTPATFARAALGKIGTFTKWCK